MSQTIRERLLQAAEEHADLAPLLAEAAQTLGEAADALVHVMGEYETTKANAPSKLDLLSLLPDKRNVPGPADVNYDSHAYEQAVHWNSCREVMCRNIERFCFERFPEVVE